MISRIIIGVLFALFLGGCSSIQVQNDYDPSFDFSQLKGFAILYSRSTAGSSLNLDRIARAIQKELEAKGYEQVDRKFADFYIVFHTNVTHKTQIVTDYERVGLYPYRYWAAPRVPVERTFHYKEGKIIIDALSPATKQIFWRGVATDVLKTIKTPEDRIKYVNKVIKKVMASFPPVRKNNEKTPDGLPPVPFGRED